MLQLSSHTNAGDNVLWIGHVLPYQTWRNSPNREDQLINNQTNMIQIYSPYEEKSSKTPWGEDGI